MEGLPPLVPDLTAWFEALLARVSALEAQSEQGGAAATAKAEAQEQALQDLQKQKEADAVAMTSMREALAERETELAAMRMEMDAIRADLAARGAVGSRRTSGMQAPTWRKASWIAWPVATLARLASSEPCWSG